MNLQQILEKQKEFQHLVGTPIDDAEQMNFLSEVFLFKAIEEIIELRKEFPSGLNKRSKSYKQADEQRIYEELSDVVLFIMNFMIVRGLSLEKLHAIMIDVQANNFKYAKQNNIQEHLN